MTPDFKLSKGDLIRVTDTLKVDGVPLNLTGHTVKFNFQSGGVNFSRDAVVVSAVAGTVEYVFAAGETDQPGLYQAQWVATVTATSVTRTFPTGSLDNDDVSGRYIWFEIVEVIPIVPPANITLIAETYEGVRSIMGDFNPQFRRWQDGNIAMVVRTCLRTGKLPGYTLTPNRLGITPAIEKPRDFALLIYQAAKMFLMPNVSDYAYKTRALSERFGDQKHFLFDLQNILFDLENGDGAGNTGVFHTWQTFYGWVNSTTGMNVWSAMTDMRVNAPVATVTLGQDGLQVNA